jgi:hypothetical protein
MDRFRIIETAYPAARAGRPASIELIASCQQVLAVSLRTCPLQRSYLPNLSEAKIKRLLMTLLDRPDLAKHIKTVKFHAGETESSLDDQAWINEREKIALDSWLHAGVIQ